MPQVGDYIYTYATGQIDKVLDKIVSTGRPEKLTFAYMRDTWLLKNAQYASVLDLLKKIDFIDNSGIPTDNYGKYQNSTIRNDTLVNGIKSAYHKLFKAYPNANELSREDLKGYFKQHTGKGDDIVRKLVTTFAHICSKAHFKNATDQSSGEQSQKGPGSGLQNNLQSGIPITMNIQIVIPNDATPDQYDKIFSSIKKHFSK